MNEEHTKALAHFKRVDPVLYAAAKMHIKELNVRPPHTTNNALFQTLCESVVSQQLSVKAADTIWNRLKSVCGGKITPQTVLIADMAEMRGAGLSGAKTKTLKELAKAITEGLILSSLRQKSATEAEHILTRIWGIGPWTTEMFLMFGLSHPDIFSARDLGLVRSMETLYGLPRDTSLKELETIAAVWSPYRTLACRILWRARDALKT